MAFTTGTLESWQRFGMKCLTLNTMPLFWAYLAMIYCSRWYTKYTRPLSVRPILILYNYTISLLSLFTAAWFAYEVFSAPSMYLKKSSGNLFIVLRIYWITKCVELLDTVFMIVRHRRRQISFLHVYHHSSMLILGDLGANHYPWVSMAPVLGLNSLIHFLLYFYYGETAHCPENPPTWKKNLTQMQILQFLVGLVFCIYGGIYHAYCIYGPLYGLSMLVLFSNFYYRAFINTDKKKKTTSYRVDDNLNESNGGQDAIAKDSVAQNGIAKKSL